MYISADICTIIFLLYSSFFVKTMAIKMRSRYDSSNSSFPTLQRGHSKSSGTSLQGVPGAIPPSGYPFSSSYSHPQTLHTYFINIPSLQSYFEPAYQKSAFDRPVISMWINSIIHTTWKNMYKLSAFHYTRIPVVVQSFCSFILFLFLSGFSMFQIILNFCDKITKKVTQTCYNEPVTQKKKGGLQ